jgi:hypothetical protein
LSFNALVVPEDPSNNGYILKPLVVCLLEACGKPNAKSSPSSNAGSADLRPGLRPKGPPSFSPGQRPGFWEGGGFGSTTPFGT